MIDIPNVQPTLAEMRPVFGAWPATRMWGYVTRSWAATMLLLTMGLAWWFSTSVGFLWIVACVVALVYGLLAFGLIANRDIDRVSRSTPLGGAAARWVLDESGVRIIFSLGDQRLDWRAIVRVVEERDRFLFAATPARTHVLPTRCLGPDQLVALRMLIAEIHDSGRLGAGPGDV